MQEIKIFIICLITLLLNNNILVKSKKQSELGREFCDNPFFRKCNDFCIQIGQKSCFCGWSSVELKEINCKCVYYDQACPSSFKN